MKTSVLSSLKDAASGILFLGFFSFWILILAPHLQVRQIDALKQRYAQEQRDIVRQTVENSGAAISKYRGELVAAGVSQDRADALILSVLRDDRFGIGGYGYFFVVDGSGVLRLHPTMPQIQGEYIGNITTADGFNFRDLLDAALRDSDAGYLEYSWPNPKTGGNDKKTTFALRLKEPPWIIAAGFYDGDLEAPLKKYEETTFSVLREIHMLVFGGFATAFALLLALSIYTNLKIRETERSLSRQMVALEQYKRILDESSMVSRTDIDGRITYVNDFFCLVTGHTKAEVIGKSHNVERHPDTPMETFKELWDTITAGRVWRGVIKNRKADGSRYYKRATILPLTDETGKITGYISSGQDITEIVEHKRDLQNAFLTDTLTGLGNRMRLLQDLQQAEDPCVFLVDIEGFGGINHAFGTDVGDSVLKQMASVLYDFSSRNGAKAYRIYADTFAILGGSKRPVPLSERAQVLASALNGLEIDIQGEKTSIITRIGFASKGNDSFAYADAALKRAKSERARVLGFDETAMMDNDSVRNLRILKCVHDALDADRVYPVFQPIARTGTKEIIKYECLMRLEDENGNTVLPDAFIGISKKTGLYRKLTLRIIESSMAYFQDKPMQFSLNLTIEDIMDPFTISYLVTEAKQKGVAGRFFVEIVETEEFTDFERAGEVLDYLQNEGIGIAIDDFGSGYSNFEYLLRLNPRYIKIDRAIVQNLFTDTRARDMLSSIVLFAKSSGIETIAEYIDSEALLEEVRVLGVDYVQGWLIGKAEPTLQAAVRA